MAHLESTGTLVARVMQQQQTATRPTTGTRTTPRASLTQDELQAYRDHLRVLVATAFALVGDDALPNATTRRALTRQDLITPFLVAALDDPRLQQVSVLQTLQVLCDSIRWGVRPGTDSRLIVDAQARGADKRFHGAPVLVHVLRPDAMVARVQRAGGYTFSLGTVCAGDVFRCDVGEGAHDFQHDMPPSVDRGPVIAYYAVAMLGEVAMHGHVLTAMELKASRWASSVRWHRSWSLMHSIGEVTALELLLRGLAVAQGDSAAVRAWIEPRPVLAPYENVAATRNAWLPGKPSDFEGYGGQAMRIVPTAVLRGVRSYLRSDRGLMQRHHATLVSIALQLMTRRLQELRVQRQSTQSRSATA
jgi:hypothetical protein